MNKRRLDNELVARKMVVSRSQAESYIKLGRVSVDGRVVVKPGYFVNEDAKIKLNQQEQYVSRAGLKLASIAEELKLDFSNKFILDVGSSTGGFTDYVLKHRAKRVIAVDVGTKQLHPSLLDNPKIELHEQTDIRGFFPKTIPEMVLIDVSFISLRDILPHIARISGKNTQIIAMLKPQFEAGDDAKHKGVIKNDAMRRDILKSFELWVKKYYAIIDKKDSKVAGAKGNLERFYILKTLTKT